MRILITGSEGYLGSHLVKVLTTAGHWVTGLDIKFSKNTNQNMDFIQGDFCDLNLLKNLMKEARPDAVIHLAALKSVQESFSIPLRYNDVNTLATLKLGNICIDSNVKKFVFISSAAVYGDCGSKAITEDSHLQPASPYGESKLQAEIGLAEIFSNVETCSLVVLRLFNLFGSDRQLANSTELISGQNLQSYIARSLVNSETLTIFKSTFPTRDGSTVRDYIHPRDASLAIELLLRTNLIDDRVINLGSGIGISTLELLQQLNAKLTNPIQLKLQDPKPGDISHAVANIDRISSLIQWKPHYSNLDSLLDVFKVLDEAQWHPLRKRFF